MSVGDALRRLLGGEPRIRVKVLVKGRIGDGWLDIDRSFALVRGSTLGDLLDVADKQAVPLREAIANSPHLAHTLMVNGERCPVEANIGRELADGDEIYLLAPLAGG